MPVQKGGIMSAKRFSFPKFHDRKSLYVGSLAGFTLTGITVVDMAYSFPTYAFWWDLLPLLIGFVLGIHCLDMLRYWKKHRIVRIVKTDTERLIYKEKQSQVK